jgi:hypothetical protein
MDRGAVGLECVANGGIARNEVGLVETVEIHGIGTRGGHGRAQACEAAALHHVQPPSTLPQRCVQGFQRMMEPPATRCPGRPLAFLVRRMRIEGHDTIAGGDGGMERGVVGKAQVAAEPDDGGAHRPSIHDGPARVACESEKRAPSAFSREA